MSIRPKEAFEAAQTFSLRDALGADLSAPQLPQSTGGNLKFNLGGLKQAALSPPEPAVQARPVSFPAGLSMRFAQAPVFEARSAPAMTHAPQKNTPLPNLSFANMQSGPGKQRMFGSQRDAAVIKEAANTKSDVMRLTAYVDELTNRLKKTQSKLEQTEHQLTRTSQVLCHERQASDQTITSYKKDLAQAHDAETKLRGEIATNKKKSALQDSTFMTSVGSALASDDQMRMQQRNLQELETKVKAMGEFKVILESELAKLNGLRDAAQTELVGVKSTYDTGVAKIEAANTQLTAAKRALEAVQVDHGSIVERLALSKVEEATLTEALSSLRACKVTAEEETATAKKATQAMLAEHGEASRKLADVQRKVAQLQCQADSATDSLAAKNDECAEAEKRLADVCNVPALTPTHAPMDDVPMFTLDVTDCAIEEPTDLPKEGETGGPPVSKCKSDATKDDDEPVPTSAPAAPSKKAKRRATISGALAPDHQLCTGPTGAAVESFIGGCSQGIAHLLGTDAPISLTLQHVAFVGSRHALIEAGAGKDDPTSLMINAVVGDLKQKLTEISEQQPVWRAVAPLA